jgi:hypothetical protein
MISPLCLLYSCIILILNSLTENMHPIFMFFEHIIHHTYIIFRIHSNHVYILQFTLLQKYNLLAAKKL